MSLHGYIVFGISHVSVLFVCVLANVLFWSIVFTFVPLLELILLAVPFMLFCVEFPVMWLGLLIEINGHVVCFFFLFRVLTKYLLQRSFDKTF